MYVPSGQGKQVSETSPLSYSLASRLRGALRIRDVFYALIVGVLIALSHHVLDYLVALQTGGSTTTVITQCIVTGCVATFACLLLFRLFDAPLFARFGWRFASVVFDSGIRSVLLLGLFIILAWLPAVIMMYPFHMGPDTVAQLLWFENISLFDPSSQQFLTDASMSDHHPVFDTLIYGAFYELGKLMGAPAYGMTLLCYIQVLFMALVFAYMCCWMHKHGVPPLLCLLSLLFWALNPVFPMLLMQIVKDLTSMPFFLLWVLCFTDCFFLIREGKAPRSSQTFALITLTLICSLTRKTLLYITVPCLLVVFAWALIKLIKAKRIEKTGVLQNQQRDITTRNHATSQQTFHVGPLSSGSVLGVDGELSGHSGYKTAVFTQAAMKASLWRIGSAIVVSVVVMMLILPRILFPIFKVEPGGVQETLALPIQQVASVVAHHHDELPLSDREVINAVLPYDKLPELFSPTGSDRVKDTWNREASSQDTKNFLIKWVELGVRYPIDYLKAPLYIGAFWTTGFYINDIPSVWFGWDDKGGAKLFPEYPQLTRTEGQDALHTLVHDTLWEGTAVGRIFFGSALYGAWIPLFVLFMLIRRKGRNLLIYLPFFLSFAVLLIVPAWQPRYLFNLLFAAPFLLALCFIDKEKPDASKLVLPRGTGMYGRVHVSGDSSRVYVHE